MKEYYVTLLKAGDPLPHEGGQLTHYANSVLLKVWDELDWNVAVVDMFIDDVSRNAILNFGRPPPPAKPQLCGGTNLDLIVFEWRPFSMTEETRQ